MRTTETQAAIEALDAAGHLSRSQAEALREGYAFLRKLQWRIRIVHASASQLIEERAPGLAPLARRMGMDVAGLVPSDRDVDGVVEMLLDATQKYAGS